MNHIHTEWVSSYGDVLSFEDGNIILRGTRAAEVPPILPADPAPADSNTTFRVHQGVLRKHSEIFRDLLDYASPQGPGQEKIDGIPVVSLQDTVEDLGSFLKCFYQPLHLLMAGSDLAYEAKGAVLLSRKYLATRLEASLLEAISKLWPKSPEEWARKEEEGERFKDVLMEVPSLNDDGDDDIYPKIKSYSGWPNAFLPEPASALNIAERFGLREILPFIYYDLTRCNVRREWDLCLKDEMQEFAGKSVVEGKAARWCTLEAPYLVKFLRIKESLKEMTRQVPKTARLFPHQNCTCPREAYMDRAGFLEEFDRECLGSSDALSFIKKLEDELREGRGGAWTAHTVS